MVNTFIHAHISTAGVPAVRDLANATWGRKYSADAAVADILPSSRDNKVNEHAAARAESAASE
jgi:hypothetical protein